MSLSRRPAEWFTIAIVVLSTAAFVACGSADNGESEPTTKQPRPDSQAGGGGAGGWTGQAAEVYSIAKKSCSAFPPKQVAGDLNLPSESDYVTIAEKFAAGYQPQFEQPAFEGCIDGL